MVNVAEINDEGPNVGTDSLESPPILKRSARLSRKLR